MNVLPYSQRMATIETIGRLWQESSLPKYSRLLLLYQFHLSLLSVDTPIFRSLGNLIMRAT